MRHARTRRVERRRATLCIFRQKQIRATDCATVAAIGDVAIAIRLATQRVVGRVQVGRAVKVATGAQLGDVAQVRLWSTRLIRLQEHVVGARHADAQLLGIAHATRWPTNGTSRSRCVHAVALCLIALVDRARVAVVARLVVVARAQHGASALTECIALVGISASIAIVTSSSKAFKLIVGAERRAARARLGNIARTSRARALSTAYFTHRFVRLGTRSRAAIANVLGIAR